MKKTRLIALIGLVAIAAAIVVPTAVVAIGSFWSAPFINQPGHLTLQNYVETVTSSRASRAAWSTLVLVIGSSFVALSLGGVQAWIVTRTNVPLRRVVQWLPVAPLLLSALISNAGFIALYAERAGFVNVFLSKTFGFTVPIVNIYSMPGLALTLGSHIAPIAFLVMLGPLRSMSRSLDEASRASGARGWRTFWHVTFPLLRPALLSSFTLAAILASHSFETPLLIGLPARITTYVSEIYISITGAVDYGLESAQAMVYLVLIGVLLWWNRRLTRAEARFSLIGGKDHRPAVTDFGRRRYLLLGVILSIFTFSFLAPLVANVFYSLLPYYRSNSPLPRFSFDNYGLALTTTNVAGAMRNSFILAGTVSLVAVLIAVFLAVVAVKTKWRFRRLAEEVGTLPTAFPPLVFSMALLITILNLPGARRLYNSVILLLIVLVVVFLPIALRVVGFDDLDRRLASRGVGELWGGDHSFGAVHRGAADGDGDRWRHGVGLHLRLPGTRRRCARDASEHAAAAEPDLRPVGDGTVSGGVRAQRRHLHRHDPLVLGARRMLSVPVTALRSRPRPRGRPRPGHARSRVQRSARRTLSGDVGNGAIPKIRVVLAMIEMGGGPDA